jgi:hypothetical protein
VRDLAGSAGMAWSVVEGIRAEIEQDALHPAMDTAAYELPNFPVIRRKREKRPESLGCGPSCLCTGLPGRSEGSRQGKKNRTHRDEGQRRCHGWVRSETRRTLLQQHHHPRLPVCALLQNIEIGAAGMSVHVHINRVASPCLFDTIQNGLDQLPGDTVDLEAHLA